MKYAYWLNQIPTTYEKKRKLELCYGTAEEVYCGTEKGYATILNEEERAGLEAVKRTWDVEKEYEALLKKDIRVVTIGQDDYPARLKHIHRPPYLLYYKGTLPPDRLTIAIVGARRCSEYGNYMAGKLGEALGRQGIPVISGMAEGIDAASQNGALRAGGYTCGVLGSGVDICFPAKNQGLYDTLEKQGGLISEFTHGEPPKKTYFPARNRLISGMSDYVVVMEAKKKSGSLITADFALEQGKEVYALPGRVTDALSFGCNQLIAQGAGIFLSVEDFLKEVLGCGCNSTGGNISKKLCLAKEETIVYSCLSVGQKSLERIIEETNMDIAVVMHALFALQGKGLVKESFQNYYIEESANGKILSDCGITDEGKDN